MMEGCPEMEDSRISFNLGVIFHGENICTRYGDLHPLNGNLMDRGYPKPVRELSGRCKLLGTFSRFQAFKISDAMMG